jgi:hypothetical protein
LSAARTNYRTSGIFSLPILSQPRRVLLARSGRANVLSLKWTLSRISERAPPTFVSLVSPQRRGTQVQDTGDIPSCCLGHEMVRTSPLPLYKRWSSPQVSHDVKSSPINSGGRCRGQRESVRVGLRASFVQTSPLNPCPFSHSLINATQQHLHNASSLRVGPSHVLCLSLDWSNRRSPTRYGYLCLHLRAVTGPTEQCRWIFSRVTL